MEAAATSVEWSAFVCQAVLTRTSDVEREGVGQQRSECAQQHRSPGWQLHLGIEESDMNGSRKRDN